MQVLRGGLLGLVLLALSPLIRPPFTLEYSTTLSLSSDCVFATPAPPTTFITSLLRAHTPSACKLDIPSLTLEVTHSVQMPDNAQVTWPSLQAVQISDEMGTHFTTGVKDVRGDVNIRIPTVMSFDHETQPQLSACVVDAISRLPITLIDRHSTQTESSTRLECSMDSGLGITSSHHDDRNLEECSLNWQHLQARRVEMEIPMSPPTLGYSSDQFFSHSFRAWGQISDGDQHHQQQNQHYRLTAYNRGVIDLIRTLSMKHKFALDDGDCKTIPTWISEPLQFDQVANISQRLNRNDLSRILLGERGVNFSKIIETSKPQISMTNFMNWEYVIHSETQTSAVCAAATGGSWIGKFVPAGDYGLEGQLTVHDPEVFSSKRFQQFPECGCVVMRTGLEGVIARVKNVIISNDRSSITLSVRIPTAFKNVHVTVSRPFACSCDHHKHCKKTVDSSRTQVLAFTIPERRSTFSQPFQLGWCPDKQRNSPPLPRTPRASRRSTISNCATKVLKRSPTESLPIIDDWGVQIEYSHSVPINNKFVPGSGNYSIANPTTSEHSFLFTHTPKDYLAEHHFSQNVHQHQHGDANRHVEFGGIHTNGGEFGWLGDWYTVPARAPRLKSTVTIRQQSQSVNDAMNARTFVDQQEAERVLANVPTLTLPLTFEKDDFLDLEPGSHHTVTVTVSMIPHFQLVSLFSRPTVTQWTAEITNTNVVSTPQSLDSHVSTVKIVLVVKPVVNAPLTTDWLAQLTRLQ